MDFLYRSEAPSYKGSAAPTAPCGGGLLAGLWRLLLGGGGQPAYRQASDASVPATGARGGSAGTASPYKAGPAPEPESFSEAPSCDCATAEDASLTGGPVSDVEVAPSDVVTSEIHIW